MIEFCADCDEPIDLDTLDYLEEEDLYGNTVFFCDEVCFWNWKELDNGSVYEEEEYSYA